MVAVVKRIGKRPEQDSAEIRLDNPMYLPMLLKILHAGIEGINEPVTQPQVSLLVIPTCRLGYIRGDFRQDAHRFHGRSALTCCLNCSSVRAAAGSRKKAAHL